MPDEERIRDLEQEIAATAELLLELAARVVHLKRRVRDPRRIEVPAQQRLGDE